MGTNTTGLKPPWEAGQSPNPGGKTGKRRKLEARFIEDLHAAWEKGGAAAIEDLMTHKPEVVFRGVASLVPKKVEHEHTSTDRERAERLLELVDRRLAELETEAARRSGTAEQSEPTPGVSTLQ